MLLGAFNHRRPHRASPHDPWISNRQSKIEAPIRDNLYSLIQRREGQSLGWHKITAFFHCVCRGLRRSGVARLSRPRFLIPAANPAPSKATRLRAAMRTLEINGKSATLMGLEQANGKQGMSLVVNQPFDVLLENKLPVPTAIHWHGLHPPNNEDGVPGLTQPVIAPNTSYHYNFPVQPAGTHWMHSHQGLQEAFLLSAPLIVHDPSDKVGRTGDHPLSGRLQLYFADRDIYAKLRKPSAKAMAMGGNKSAGMAMSKPDANDVNYDAYLVNDRTLADPEVVRVEKNGRLRLRIINGSSGTNFFVDLGDLKGELIATDGMPVNPVSGSRFPLAIAQRIDVRVQLPARRRISHPGSS